MQRRIILFLCVLDLWKAAMLQDECQITQILNGKLLYDNRLLYMEDNFPLDYKLYVTYEDVLRYQNITSLIKQGITVKELRYLWGIVNEGILLKIKAVLREKHPSFTYVSDLLTIFKALMDTQREREMETNTTIMQDILERRRIPDAIGKPVRPKALMDNCFKVLYALYEEECGLCNPSYILSL
ncbi:interleukin-34 [Bombina bombina]|uniref:interleukin-34 n=1 Tax=Bombina bombina TaxID=8345 RepID=UPI00235A8880|nr:interleukin-34 [Bombina bombina]XP_053558269.1 interleukin-34 [Bombina bombina]XP_053558276.1 interleukin-34 [Bombina bombina]